MSGEGEFCNGVLLSSILLSFFGRVSSISVMRQANLRQYAFLIVAFI